MNSNQPETTATILPSKNARLVSLRRRFRLAAEQVQPAVRANYASAQEYIAATQEQAQVRKGVQALAMQLMKLDRSNRLYWERQYDRYDSCYSTF
jgi:hypothetical protein